MQQVPTGQSENTGANYAALHWCRGFSSHKGRVTAVASRDPGGRSSDAVSLIHDASPTALSAPRRAGPASLPPSSGGRRRGPRAGVPPLPAASLIHAAVTPPLAGAAVALPRGDGCATDTRRWERQDEPQLTARQTARRRGPVSLGPASHRTSRALGPLYTSVGAVHLHIRALCPSTSQSVTHHSAIQPVGTAFLRASLQAGAASGVNAGELRDRDVKVRSYHLRGL